MMKVKEAMTRNPEIVRSEDSVKRAAEIMKRLNVGVVPVYNGEDAIGILTDRDIAVRLAADGKDPNNTRSGDLMSRDLITCSENTDATDAAKIMSEKKIRRLLVRDHQGKITGVISLGDIAVSLGSETSGRVIREVSHPAEPKR
jgi:CBS domain-containing protein